MTRGPVICDVHADFVSHPLTEPPSTEQRAATMTALAELDAWAEKALVMPLFDELLPDDAPEPVGQNIDNHTRANYVASVRISIIIQQLERIPSGAVTHPKSKDIERSLKVWANNCFRAAEPGGQVPWRV